MIGLGLFLLSPALLVGGDVSEIPEVEASGARYYEHFRASDPFEILQRAGWNLVRFRVWNDPKDGWCDKEHTLQLAKRAKAHGMAISIDFHYSDWWADPGKQFKPAAWKNLSFDQLNAAVRDFTQDVVAALVRQGTPPAMVQIGNEIIGGMLWPEGKVDSNNPEQWHRLARLINSGIRGVHDAQGSQRIQTMLHLDRGANNESSRWWFDHILAEGVKFDLIGQSYYPFWHGHLDALKANLDDLARRYKKDIYIVETAYPWVIEDTKDVRVYNGEQGLEPGYPATPEGQAAFLRKVCQIVRQVPNGHGKGVLYWAPTWIAPRGQKRPYSNMALFDFNGNALPGVRALGSN